AVEPNKRRGTAADVDQDYAVGVRINQRRAAGGCQHGFGFTVDDFELEANLVGDAGAEFGAVRRGTTRLGRDQPRTRHAAIAHLVAADRECCDRTVDRRIAAAAGRRHALAEADDARERIDDAEAVADRARAPEPAIVGAEIERGIGRTGLMDAALRAVMTRKPVR